MKTAETTKIRQIMEAKKSKKSKITKTIFNQKNLFAIVAIVLCTQFSWEVAVASLVGWTMAGIVTKLCFED